MKIGTTMIGGRSKSVGGGSQGAWQGWDIQCADSQGVAESPRPGPHHQSTVGHGPGRSGLRWGLRDPPFPLPTTPEMISLSGPRRMVQSDPGGRPSRAAVWSEPSSLRRDPANLVCRIWTSRQRLPSDLAPTSKFFPTCFRLGTFLQLN